MIISILAILLIAGSFSSLSASTQDEIDYLLKNGQKVLIEGTRRGVRKWDFACRLFHKTNYVAIVQNDGANYRLVPSPRNSQVEKICPSGIFNHAIRWYKDLQKASY